MSILVKVVNEYVV